jgi:4-amino-4-deoxy-L-arabinose transferase-like glycosyltransferase
MKFQQLLDHKLFYLLLVIVVFFAFAKLGSEEVHQWDEARTGVNAVDMIKNGDIINLHFAGEPDKIRAKPPFVVWMVATNFQLFGYNRFSLRIHSALATIAIFLLLYQIIILYKSHLFAFATCLTLIPTRAIVGFHVGRTGDFDAVLIAFILAGLWQFLRYLDFDKKKAIYWAALLWGLAFFTKGPAMGVLFPGLAIYVLMRARLGSMLSQKSTYWAVGLLLAFPIAWYSIIAFFGTQLDDPLVSGQNAFERMFLYDLRDRFTQTEFEGKIEEADPFFFFNTLSITYRYWHWVFYAVCAWGIVAIIRQREKLFGENGFVMQKEWQLLFLSVPVWFFLGLFLSIATVTKTWYLSPAVPFVAITTVYGFDALIKYFKYSPHIFLALLVFTFMMRFLGPKGIRYEFNPGNEDFNTELITQFTSELRESETIHQIGEWPAQRVLLWIYFENLNINYLKSPTKLADIPSGELVFTRNTYLDEQKSQFSSFELIGKDENYAILRKE